MKFKGSTLYVVLAYDCISHPFIGGVFSKLSSAEAFKAKYQNYCEIKKCILQ